LRRYLSPEGYLFSFLGGEMEREHIIFQILDRDNWSSVEQIDSFIYVYDKMPLRMRLVVDLRMTGESIREIAQMLSIKEETVRVQLHNAKKRIMKALF